MCVVDAGRVKHFAYPTARRTLCLDRLVSECSAERSAEHGCPTCAEVRGQLRRPGSGEAGNSLLRGWVYAVIARVRAPSEQAFNAAGTAFPWKL